MLMKSPPSDKHENLVNFFLDRYLEHVFGLVATPFLHGLSSLSRCPCGQFSPHFIIFVKFFVFVLLRPSLEVKKVRGIIPVVVILLGGLT